jgi:hypothetical protein
MAIINGKIHYKWPFSIATLNYQRVDSESGEKPRGESISSLQTFIAGTLFFRWVNLPDPFCQSIGASAWFRHKKNPIESSESHQWIDISL